MRSVELLVAIAGEDQRVNALEPAAEQLQDVERGLVRPMHVLKDENRRTPPVELADESAGDLVGRRFAVNELRELTPGLVGDVEERPQRCRGQQRLAGAPEDARRPPPLVAELSQQGRLSDPRLTTDEHQPSGGVGKHGAERFPQHR